MTFLLIALAYFVGALWIRAEMRGAPLVEDE
jgi:hypothetical protein